MGNNSTENRGHVISEALRRYRYHDKVKYLCNRMCFLSIRYLWSVTCMSTFSVLSLGHSRFSSQYTNGKEAVALFVPVWNLWSV
jgi:hypothetical protein